MNAARIRAQRFDQMVWQEGDCGHAAYAAAEPDRPATLSVARGRHRQTSSAGFLRVRWNCGARRPTRPAGL